VDVRGPIKWKSIGSAKGILWADICSCWCVCPWSLYSWRPCFRFDFMCVRQALRCFLPRRIPQMLDLKWQVRFCVCCDFSLCFLFFSEANDRLEIVSFIVAQWSVYCPLQPSTLHLPSPQNSTSKRAPIINLWIAAGRIKVVHHHYH